MALIDIQLIEGLGLPYTAGAEAALEHAALDPMFAAAWDQLLLAFPGVTLQPLFDALPIEELADLVDAVRLEGEEPPNPFVWFTVPCDDAIADTLLAALQTLPFVIYAGIRAPVTYPISYGTNPDSIRTLQIQPSPNGVDAVYAWDVAGGTGVGTRIADIEGGWRLDHEELISAQIRRVSMFGSIEVDHGTAVAGILVGADNGVGTIGIVPDAALDLITTDRGNGIHNVAAAITVAARHLQRGDIILLEIGRAFTPDPRGDILVEFDPAVQVAIRLAVDRGITVIEPAGNGNINLDAFPFLAHTRPESPTFSGAIVVGAAVLTNFETSAWSRTFCSFGSRVDCFAAGANVRAPASSATNAYQVDPQFSGTSSASAIVAGVAASLQSMTRAATGDTLAPADVRRLLRSASLGLLPDDPLGARIGPMPDLRKIIRAQGLARILPISAAPIVGDALFITYLDADNRMVRRHWTFFTGWGAPLSADSPNELFELNAAQPAVLAAEETDPVARLRYDAFFSGPLGIHHMWWDSNGQAGDVSRSIAGVQAAAQGRALAVAAVLPNRIAIAAISPQARIVVMSGDPQVLLAGLTAPTVIDAVGNYRRIAGPTMVSRGGGSADIVAIEDGGSLNWYTGNVLATIGTGWSGPFQEPSGVQFEPGARPALLVVASKLLAAAVGSDGWLRVVEIDPAATTVSPATVVDVQATIATDGPVALATAGGSLVVLAVDTERLLRAATRPAAGGEWTPLLPILSSVSISPLGGVAAVSIDLGVMAIAVGVDGSIQSSLSTNGLLWSPLLPLL